VASLNNGQLTFTLRVERFEGAVPPTPPFPVYNIGGEI
jgi:hypothetical protein